MQLKGVRGWRKAKPELLDEYGGIENLQEHPNEEEVYQMAIKILGDIYPLRKMATTKTWHRQ